MTKEKTRRVCVREARSHTNVLRVEAVDEVLGEPVLVDVVGIVAGAPHHGQPGRPVVGRCCSRT
jgi:hypothetical protein